MHVKKWAVLILFFSFMLLFMGCEDAQAYPQSRELVVVNGTTDADIFHIEITGFPFGQRAAENTGSFLFREDSVVGPEDRFAISLSPYVYRVAVTIRFIQEGDEYGDRSKRVTIDLPAGSTLPTYITLVYDADAEFPGFTLGITGAYVDFDMPMLA
jgi:hypothetical protein